MKEKDFTYKDILTPKHRGTVLLNQYWVVDEEGKGLFYRDEFPQCNPSLDVANHLHPDKAVKLVPIAYLG